MKVHEALQLIKKGKVVVIVDGLRVATGYAEDKSLWYNSAMQADYTKYCDREVFSISLENGSLSGGSYILIKAR